MACLITTNRADKAGEVMYVKFFWILDIRFDIRGRSFLDIGYLIFVLIFGVKVFGYWILDIRF